jgi:hypothetical protein
VLTLIACQAARHHPYDADSAHAGADLEVPGCHQAFREPSARTGRILATIQRARFRMPQRVLAGLFGVVIATISKAEHQIRPLLDQYHATVEPTGTSFGTLAELTVYAAAHGITLIPGTKPVR